MNTTYARNSIGIILMLFFFVACNEGSNTKLSIKDGAFLLDNGQIDLKEKIVDINDLNFDITRVVPLETNEECLVGSFSDFLIEDGNIFIADDRKTKSVLQFSSDGKFKNKIHRVGKGDGEYLYISNFFKLNDGAGYAIQDIRLRKLLLFSKDLEFQKVVPFPYSFEQIQPLGDSYIAVNRKSDSYYLSKLDSHFNIVDTLFKRPNYVKKFEFGLSDHMKYNAKTEEILFHPQLFNGLYKFNGKEMKLSYGIKNKNLFPDKSFYVQHKDGDFNASMMDLTSNKKITFMIAQETKTKVMLRYRIARESYISIFDKKTKKTISFPINKENPMSLLIANTLYINKKGELVCLIRAFHGLNCPEIKNKLTQNVGEEDNPIIVFIHLDSLTL
ncbi:6-bladed beta-propeller [Halosquirtibacter laminarini]|uniref:6-bladed beta-propeller n=1 Tax=Halosquirtibacter laminarini TaxID=3374600 RepID=A0AC61NCX1_9BACT|nr:6-bladed beta-propeller [Prolixibacteraceae bacterium]